MEVWTVHYRKKGFVMKSDEIQLKFGLYSRLRTFIVINKIWILNVLFKTDLLPSWQDYYKNLRNCITILGNSDDMKDNKLFFQTFTMKFRNIKLYALKTWLSFFLEISTLAKAVLSKVATASRVKQEKKFVWETQHSGWLFSGFISTTSEYSVIFFQDQKTTGLYATCGFTDLVYTCSISERIWGLLNFWVTVVYTLKGFSWLWCRIRSDASCIQDDVFTEVIFDHTTHRPRIKRYHKWLKVSA